MNQAIRIISRDFGSDAILLDAQKVRKKGFLNRFKKPHYEILVEYDPAKTPLAMKMSSIRALAEQKKAEAEPVPKPSGGPAGAAADHGPPKQEAPPPAPFAGNAAGGEEQTGKRTAQQFDFAGIERMTARLVGNRVDREIAYDIAKEAMECLNRQPELSAYDAFFQAASNRIVQSDNIFPEEAKSAVLFLGATGVGKTTSLVKIAAGLSTQAKKKVGIINTDTYRIAAHEQLNIYSDILAIPLKVAYDGEMVAKALQELSDRDVILIDTAGKRPGDPEHRAFVETMISQCGLSNILLAVSAPTSFEACREIIDSYRFLPDYKLLITKLDEISAYGNLWNLCDYSGKEVTYLTTGQNVPKDIEPGETGKMIRLVLDER